MKVRIYVHQKIPFREKEESQSGQIYLNIYKQQRTFNLNS